MGDKTGKFSKEKKDLYSNKFYTMKTLIKLLTISFIVWCTASINAQEKITPNNILENTQWQGIANIPSPETVILQFSKDVYTVMWNGKTIEQMNYTVQGDSITVVKTSGASPCLMLSQGTYKFTIANDKLSLVVISDSCSQRISALGINTYTKVLPSEHAIDPIKSLQQ